MGFGSKIVFRLSLTIVLVLISVVSLSVYAEKSAVAEFGMEYSSFINSNAPYFGAEVNSKNLATVGLAYRFQGGGDTEESVIDFNTFYSFVEGSTYINPKEAFYDFGDRDEDLILGRKKYTWSESDEAWNTGLWQPQFKWDPTHPEQQGIVGGFWAKKIGKRNIKIFVSPVFVPDVGPTIKESGGKISSNNPWFRPPPPTAPVINDTETDIYGRIEMPDITEIVFNPGMGFRVDQELNDHEGIGFAYAYKPINQILNAFEYKLRAADQGGGVNLTFYPWVGYHHLTTIDWKHSDREYQHLLSVTYEKPTGLFRDPDLNYQRLDESYVLSWLTRWNLAGEGASAVQLYGGYLRNFDGYQNDGGDAISEGTQFGIRAMYFSVVKLGIRYPIWTQYRRLVNSFEVNYDMLLNGGTLLSQLEYTLSDSWVMNLNMDLLGVFDQAHGKYVYNWINTYRANDKVSFGMSYVY